MSNLLWKKKMKRKEKKMKTKTKTYRTIEKKTEEEKREETWTLLNTAYRKKKKERTDIFSKIDSTSVHRLKKEEKKTEHFWTVIVILFWLVVKWNFLSLSLKATLEFFFSCSYYEIWRKPFTEDFILCLLIFVIILILKTFFFRIWGFRGIGNIFGGSFCFEESVADVRIGQTFIQMDLQIVVESNSIEEFADLWSCWWPIWLLFFSWSSEDGIKEKRRGLLKCFGDDVWVFQSRWCFGFVCNLAKRNESGKGEVPIYW